MSMGSLQGIVEDSASAPGMASGEPSPDLVAERKRLRQCADGLVVRSLQLKELQDTLRYQQQELENAEKLGARALRQLKLKAQRVLVKANRALSKPQTGQAASGAEPQAPGPACEPGAGLEGEPQAGAAKQSSGGLHAEPAGSAGEAPLLPEAPCSGEGHAKSEKCADKPPQASGQGAATSTDAAMVITKRKSMKEAKAKAAAAAPKGKGKAKRGRGGARAPQSLEDIEIVRARAKANLPEGSFQQRELSDLMPPQCNVWNNWRGKAWGVHLRGHRRMSKPWAEAGRDRAGLILCAEVWRLWLKQNDLGPGDCPINGLLDVY